MIRSFGKAVDVPPLIAKRYAVEDRYDFVCREPENEASDVLIVMIGDGRCRAFLAS
jgi:hypothetical protein